MLMELAKTTAFLEQFKVTTLNSQSKRRNYEISDYHQSLAVLLQAPSAFSSRKTSFTPGTNVFL